VFVPRFVLTHVRVLADPDGLRVELWEHVRQAPSRLRWIERLAILGTDRGASAASTGTRMIGSARIAR
jgi:hypothetical protein